MPPKSGSPSRTPGRYRMHYCNDVVEFMAKGYSLTAFAGEIGASRATLTKWCKEHVLFAEAVERAQARRARVLEDKMLAAKSASAFDAHMQALKTAAPDEWTDAVAKRDRRAAPAVLEAVRIELPDNSRD